MDILFIGDSLMEYFDWDGRFPEHRVVNLGVSGETVGWLLERLPRITSKYPRADMVFLMTGINNVAMEEGAAFFPAYRQVVEELRAAYPGASIYIHSLLPTFLPWIKPRSLDEVNAFLRSLAEETGTTYLDVHSAFMAGNLKKLLSTDGIHLSEKGYELWAGILASIIPSA